MRLTILFLLIFSNLGLYAQLYISPSSKADSYLYAKDRLVFVEKDIHLQKNHQPETEASFYLRKGAQLLQGENKEHTNSGDGYLSVFQKGTANAYDYNYWGLPVKTHPEKPFLNDYLYEPVSPTRSMKASLTSGLEGKSTPLHISNRWIYAYAGNGYSSWQYLGNNFDLLPGEGFTMKGVNGINLTEIEQEKINLGSAQTYDFRGTANNGRIELPIRKDQTLLLGNPYPSALDLNRFLMDNTATTGIAYFWDSRKNGNSHYLADYEGGYGTYSPGANLYLPAIFKKYGTGLETGETGSIYPRRYMPIAQGFMVIGKTDGNIFFQNSQRTYQKEKEGVSQLKTAVNDPSTVILDIEIDSVYIQQLALVFNQHATENVDHAMDAKKMDQSKINIGWSISGDTYVINVRPKIDRELIPLKMKLSKPAVLNFSVSRFINFNPDRLFLYDALDDLYFAITTGSLKLDLPEGEYPDRFFISFIEKLPEEAPKEEPVTTDLEDRKKPLVLLNTIDIFQNNRGQQLEVKVLYNTELKSVKLYDLNGKLYLNQNFRSREKEFNFATGNLSNAVYIVKVLTNDHRELTKKISIKN